MPRYTAFCDCPDGLSKRGAVAATPRLPIQDEINIPRFCDSRK